MKAPTTEPPPGAPRARWTAIDVLAVIAVVGTLAGVVLRLAGVSGGLLVGGGTVAVCGLAMYLLWLQRRRRERRAGTPDPPERPPDL